MIQCPKDAFWDYPQVFILCPDPKERYQRITSVLQIAGYVANSAIIMHVCTA